MILVFLTMLLLRLKTQRQFHLYFWKNIYVAGYETNNGKNVTTYRENDVATARSIFVVSSQGL